MSTGGISIGKGRYDWSFATSGGNIYYEDIGKEPRRFKCDYCGREQDWADDTGCRGCGAGLREITRAVR